jgi:hypothetical protein
MILPGDITPYTDEERSWLNAAYDLIRDKIEPAECDGVILRAGKHYCDPFWILDIDKMCWMATAPIDLYAHKCILDDMYGDVCLTGLGIGVGLIFAEANPRISNITIIENDMRVANAVWNMHLDLKNVHKAKLIIADANKFDFSNFDCTFIDHTPNVQAELEVLDRAYNQTKVFNWYDIAISIEDRWRSRPWP